MNKNIIINRHETVQKAWLTYRQEVDRPVLEYYDKYKSDEERNKMQEALVFWKFMRTDINFTYNDEYPSNDLKRGFLQTILNEAIPNYEVTPYVRIIAQIEMLPTTIWRKILWEYNIDFQSYESCLRRITHSQIVAIGQNWDALFVSNSKPPVLDIGLRNKLKYRLLYTCKFTSNTDLFSENLFDYTRYQSKGAWAYSLLGLDFGFGKYPNGITDDKEIKDRKIGRFFSIKNHVNDFVVNQEDGKYWWAYRTARKNFIWKAWSEKDVELKSHICPGFWLTLILHLIFWVVSPLLFTNGLALFIYHGHVTWYIATLMILGAITPLWLLCAVVVFIIFAIITIWEAVEHLFKKTIIGQKIANYLSKHIIPKVLMIVIVGIIALFIYACLLGPSYWFKYTLLRHYSIQTSLLLGASFLTSLCMSIFKDDLDFTGSIFEEFNTKEGIINLWLTTLGIFISILFIGYLDVLVNAGSAVYHWIISICIGIGHWFQSNWIPISRVSVSLGALFIIIRPFYFVIEDERAYLRASRLIIPAVIVWTVVLISLHIAEFGSIIFTLPREFSQAAVYVVTGFIAAIGIMFYIFQKPRITLEKIEHKELIEQQASNASNKLIDKFNWHNIKGSRHVLQSILTHALLYNTWLYKKLQSGKLHIVLDEVVELTLRFYDENGGIYSQKGFTHATNFLWEVLPNVDDNYLKIFRTHKDLIAKESSELIVLISRYLRNGFSNIMDIVEQVSITNNTAEKQEKKKKESIEKIKRILSAFFHGLGSPFRWLHRNVFKPLGIWLRYKKEDLRNLWELFNERCPSVNKSRHLP